MSKEKQLQAAITNYCYKHTVSEKYFSMDNNYMLTIFNAYLFQHNDTFNPTCQ